MPKTKSTPQAKPNGTSSRALYRAEFAAQAMKYCMLGATNRQLSALFEVGERTVERWMQQQPEFAEAVKRGRVEADAAVAESLFHRAKGYSHTAVKIMHYKGEVIREEYTEHYPPDTVAGMFWLQNRRPDIWRDMRRLEVTGKDGEAIAEATDAEVAKRLAFLLAKADADEKAKAQLAASTNGSAPAKVH